MVEMCTERGRVRRVLVVGAGVSGLATTVALAELGVPVLLMSPKAARYHRSSRPRDGLAAATGWNSTGFLESADSAEKHFEDAVICGGYGMSQPPLRSLVEAAPQIVERLHGMGVPLQGASGGGLQRRLGLGASLPRVLSLGLDSGRQIADVLDGAVRSWECTGVTDSSGAWVPGERMVQRLEGWVLQRLVQDDAGVVVGVVAQESRSLTQKAWPADAVCLATGAPLAVRARELGSTAALGMAMEAGAIATQLEWAHHCPLAVETARGLRPLGDGLLAHKARLFVAREPEAAGRGATRERERDYAFDREFRGGSPFPSPDRLARAIRAREGGGEAVFLDLSLVPSGALESLLPRGGLGRGRKEVRVVPLVAASQGGLWVDWEAGGNGFLLPESPRNHATSLPGLYAVGGAAAQYHGRAELSGNGLVASIFGAALAARGMAAHRSALARSAFDLPGSVFERAESRERAITERLLSAAEEKIREPGEARVGPLAWVNEFRSVVSEVFSATNGSDQRQEGTAGSGVDPNVARWRSRLEELRQRVSQGAGFVATPALNGSLQAVRELGQSFLVAEAMLCALGARRSLARKSETGASLRTVLVSGTPASSGGAPGQAPPAVREVTEVTYPCVGKAVTCSSALDTRWLAPPPGSRG